MPDIVHLTYGQTGKSTQTNTMGMRDMQIRAFDPKQPKPHASKSKAEKTPPALAQQPQKTHLTSGIPSAPFLLVHGKTSYPIQKTPR